MSNTYAVIIEIAPGTFICRDNRMSWCISRHSNGSVSTEIWQLHVDSTKAVRTMISNALSLAKNENLQEALDYIDICIIEQQRKMLKNHKEGTDSRLRKLQEQRQELDKKIAFSIQHDKWAKAIFDLYELVNDPDLIYLQFHNDYPSNQIAEFVKTVKKTEDGDLFLATGEHVYASFCVKTKTGEDGAVYKNVYEWATHVIRRFW